MRTEFNPSNNSNVDVIKQKTAELINACEDIKQQDMPANEGENESDTDARRASQNRLIALAQTAYEEAAMWAVKAATV